ncbi:MAG: trypsin-like peptidase domain-containing protein [Chloroflexi bacterium]|nr:trypsin-like peptidase domain-containing protein [Chloroflexota bacterium]MYK35200.1 trypsin-like peptidase domain-containing protein [Chloroflexota bacterium]
MSQAQSQINRMIERTFHIRTRLLNGTAFAIEQGNHQYLVTAKHIVGANTDQLMPGEAVQLFSDNGQAMSAQVQHLAVSPGDPDSGDVDVAVLELAEPVIFSSEALPIGRQEDIFVTQRVAMPTAEQWINFGHEFGIPVRCGTIAKIFRPERRGRFTGDFLVEMEAYQGFSGSPIIYWTPEGRASIIGIAARLSWRTIREAFGPNPVHTGFIGGFYVQHALELMREMN